MPGGTGAGPGAEARLKPGPEVFAQLYREYVGRIYAYVCYRLLPGQDAEDITAEIFEAALRAFPRYRPEVGSVETWLFAIARNRLSRHFRALRLRRFLRLESVSGHERERRKGPEEIASDQEMSRLVRRLVAELPAREREVLALKFGADLTNRAIAGLTGLSESNVGTTIHRALQRLRKGVEM